MCVCVCVCCVCVCVFIPNIIPLSAVKGKVAIHSPSTGIVDWGRVTRAYGEDLKKMGGHIFTNFKVPPPPVTLPLIRTGQIITWVLVPYVDI